MIDTHCHLYKEYYNDIDLVIKESHEVNVNRFIVNGTSMKSNIETLKLSNKYDEVYAAIGFHPTELDDFDDEYFNWLEEHINNEKVVAVGEIGLDYHYDNTDKEKQIYVFKKQLELAEKYNKPVIIHSRDSIGDTLEILKKYNVKGSIHSFSGSVEMAREFTNLGFMIGVGGVITFKNAKHIKEVVKNIDLSYILLETDSPYLTPEPYRGMLNSPKYIPLIVKEIARLKMVSESYVISNCYNNTNRLFDFSRN